MLRLLMALCRRSGQRTLELPRALVAPVITRRALRWGLAEPWQPLRETLERLLIAYDWGEAFTALNLVVKPMVDGLLDWQFAELAERNNDQFLALLFGEFHGDALRSQHWTSDLVAYALAAEPKLREVLSGWIDDWSPRAYQAVDGLAPLFEQAPVALPADGVCSAVRDQHEKFLAVLR